MSTESGQAFPTTFRITASGRESLDAVAATLRKQTGVNVSRADVILLGCAAVCAQYGVPWHGSAGLNGGLDKDAVDTSAASTDG